MLAFGEEARGFGVDAGEAASDLFFRLVGQERFVGGLLQEGQAAGVGGEFDFGGA